jgi:RecJ-like exonuclease
MKASELEKYLPKEIECPYCIGTGETPEPAKCPGCNGLGKILE